MADPSNLILVSWALHTLLHNGFCIIACEHVLVHSWLDISHGLLVYLIRRQSCHFALIQHSHFIIKVDLILRLFESLLLRHGDLLEVEAGGVF